MITDIVTKLSIEDYNLFLILTKLEYQAGLTKEESTSELLRFTIRHILSQISNNRIYHLLKQHQQQQNTQNNQQQYLHNQFYVLFTITSHQQSPKLYQIPNLQTLKTISSLASISLPPNKTNAA